MRRRTRCRKRNQKRRPEKLTRAPRRSEGAIHAPTVVQRLKTSASHAPTRPHSRQRLKTSASHAPTRLHSRQRLKTRELHSLTRPHALQRKTTRELHAPHAPPLSPRAPPAVPVRSGPFKNSDLFLACFKPFGVRFQRSNSSFQLFGSFRTHPYG